MKPRQIFGIVVRTFGLCLTIYAAWYVLFAMAILAGIQNAYRDEVPGYLLTGIPAAIAGLYLLRGAPLLLDFSYSRGDRSDD